MNAQRRIALLVLAALVTLAVVGPLLGPDRLSMPDPLHGALHLPSPAHWLGTDQFSRDIFARLAWGARVSLSMTSAEA